VSDASIERRIAVILAADVVGYSRLMGDDEEATHATLKAYGTVIRQLIDERGGSVFGSAGDSIMAEFSSAVEAVRCATEIQLELDRRNLALLERRRMLFRIGIHLGDIMVEGEDRMGDSVNVAARLEALATPGGVCISNNVIVHVRERLGLQFEDLGQHRVKNISHPVHVYRVPLASEFHDVSPFRGLSVFDYGDARFFHGRSQAITTAKERLVGQAEAGTAFLLIYGMSGTGKSSLVRAGVLPALTKMDAVDGLALSRFCILRPSEGPSPVGALESALRRDDALPELAFDSRLISADPKAFTVELVHVLSAAAGANARLVIAVDQLEEMFTSDQIDAAMRQAFIDLLTFLARSGAVWVLGTIRTDFLHHCSSVSGFSALKDGLGSYELLPPSGPEIAQIIRNPARTVGLRFEESPEKGRLEDVLQSAAAGNPMSLPLLEFVLDMLYERGKGQNELTFADYEALGGLEGAIAQRADDVVASLPDDVQGTLPSILRSLIAVRLRDDIVTAKPARKDDVATTQSHERLIDAFVAARLFVGDQDESGETIIRVAHEALLTHWPRAQAIIVADREFLETRSRVQADAARWLVEHKSDDLLLPDGKRLVEAEDVLSRRRSDLDDTDIAYIETSIAAWRARREVEQASERHYLALEAEAARDREANARRLAKRTRLAAVITLFLAMFAAIGAAIGFFGQREAVRHADLAEENATQARLAEEEAERQARFAESQAQMAKREAERARVAEQDAELGDSLYRAVQTRQMVAENMPVTGIQLALAGLPSNPGEHDRGWVGETAGALVEALGVQKEKHVLRGHAGSISALVFDDERIISASWDDTVRIWDAKTGQQQTMLRGYGADVLAVALSPDHARIAVGGRANTVQVWDTRRNEKILDLEGHERDVLAVAFLPDGERIVSGSRDKTLRIWNATTGEQIDRLSGHHASVSALAVSPDGNRIVSGSRDGTIKIWNAQTGDVVTELMGHEQAVFALSFFKDGERIVSGSKDRTVRIWNATSGESLRTLTGHTSDVYAVAVFGDDRRVLSGSGDDTTRIWDSETGAQLDVLKGHSQSVFALAIAPDDSQIVSGSRDNTIRLWTVSGSDYLTTWREEDAVHALGAFSRDDTLLVSAIADSTMRLWRIGAKEPLLALRGHEGVVLAVAVSPDDSRIVSGSSDNTARIWDLESGQQLQVLDGHRGDVTAVAFSPDGEYIISGSGDNSVRVWDPSSGRELMVLKHHGADVHAAGDVTAVAVSPDGRQVASASRDNAIRLWNLETGQPLGILEGHPSDVLSIAFFPDGKRLVSVSDDTTVRIWNIASGQQLRAIQDHERSVTTVAVSPDGERIASGSSDQTVRLWDVETGEQLLVLRGHDAAVTTVNWTSDGARIISGAVDNTIRVTWVGRSLEELIDTGKKALPRELTAAEKKKFHLKSE